MAGVAPSGSPRQPGIRVSNPYEGRHFLKRVLFHKRLFGAAVDHAVVRLMGGAYVRLLQKEPDRLFSWVEIETVNRCNSTCSFCPVNKKDDPREFAYMPDWLFHKVIDELAALKFAGRLALYSNNEPLLDDKIVERVAYAKASCPQATVYILTNGTRMTTEIAWQLLQAGIDYIKIDNYSDKLKLHRNIEKLIVDFEKPPYAEHADRIFIVKRRLTEVLSNRGGTAPNKEAEEQEKTYKYYHNASCGYPFTQLVIRPDGKVSLCCNDALGKATMGDVSRRSLVEVWRGKAFRQLRAELTTNGRKDLSICNSCDVYTHDPDMLLKHSRLLRAANNVFHLRARHWK